jgi:formate hydrogenlyase subunit 3/multisubunit Na+/H+ antiporter MnhD subunit
MLLLASLPIVLFLFTSLYFVKSDQTRKLISFIMYGVFNMLIMWYIFGYREVGQVYEIKPSSINMVIFANTKYTNIFASAMLISNIIIMLNVINNIKQNIVPIVILYVSSIFSVIYSDGYMAMFIFAEIASIFGIILFIHSNKNKRLFFYYISLHIFSGIIGIISISMIHTANIYQMNDMFKFGSILFSLSCLINVGIFPFFGLITNIYSSINRDIATILASFSSKIFLFIILSIGIDFRIAIISFILMTLYGFFYAIKEDTIFKSLLYYTIMSSGLMIIGSIYENVVDGMAIMSLYHIPMMTILFSVLRNHDIRFSNIHSIAIKNKTFMLLFLTICILIIGIPITPGFISKYYIHNIQNHYIRYMAMINIIMSITYALRIVRNIFHGNVTKIDQDNIYISKLSLLLLIIFTTSLSFFYDTCTKFYLHNNTKYNIYSYENVFSSILIITFIIIVLSSISKKLQDISSDRNIIEEKISSIIVSIKSLYDITIFYTSNMLHIDFNIIEHKFSSVRNLSNRKISLNNFTFLYKSIYFWILLILAYLITKIF